MSTAHLPAATCAKSATGIKGFDQMTGGGVPRGRTTLVIGGPGSGKTIFGLQFLAEGVRSGEPGILVAFEETSERIVANAHGFGWGLDQMAPGEVFFLDAQPSADLVQVGDFDLNGMIVTLDAKATEMGAGRIVFDVEESLRVALGRDEFVLHYQPKIDLASGAVIGAEALIRWTHPIRGLVSPAAFIPIAEQSGLIVPIGRWVLREACRQTREWRQAGLSVGNMAVNVSSVELRHPGFLDHVLEVLDETGPDAGVLELELTETVLMKDIDTTAVILQHLRERGVKVALDDFGTGYSSLSYLHRFPIDSLKIDRSFVSQINVESGSAPIVVAIISMARSLKLRVVAEGVETAAQLAFLQGLACDEAQGYYFSSPVPAAEFAKYFKRRHGAPSIAAGVPKSHRSATPSTSRRDAARGSNGRQRGRPGVTAS